MSTLLSQQGSCESLLLLPLFVESYGVVIIVQIPHLRARHGTASSVSADEPPALSCPGLFFPRSYMYSGSKVISSPPKLASLDIRSTFIVIINLFYSRYNYFNYNTLTYGKKALESLQKDKNLNTI